ncbi:hypothetical protein QVD17_02135 [Tagetes erecta]|uniref:BHLH domain-containing protein n=1 Tax=Tagetes erecta TaxID=13708 RepID=A0AAD8LBV5_TARER|nr:hypothetical protein QVD17_02135 [Tagetes erecta]
MNDLVWFSHSDAHKFHTSPDHNMSSLQDFHDDFLEQMLCALQSGHVSLPELSTVTGDANKSILPWDVDQSAFLTNKLRQHQISSGNDTAALQQHLFQSAGDSSPFQNHTPTGDNSIQPLFNELTGSIQSNNFQYPPPLQAQSFRPPAPETAINQGGGGGSGPPAQPRQRVRARRGQATDPHSIAERLRRERIAERMKSLQELVPNANKTDKASMLDEIIDYVKFLQLQVKVLSMSRMGGVAAVAPLVTDISSEGGRESVQPGVGGGAGNETASSSNNDTMTVAENRVVKLMEEDMGSAMQYLQGKGLCLMPISLATAISTTTATCHLPSVRNNHPAAALLGVQSANAVLPTEVVSIDKHSNAELKS